MSKAGALFLTGARQSLPIALGYVPVGIAYAVLALQSGFSPLQTQLFSLMHYSGSGQFLAAAMAAQGAGLVAITIGCLLMNFRYFIMSTCVFRRFKSLNLWYRLGFCHLVTDETFAIFTTAPQERICKSYFAGLFICSYFSWNLGTFLGIIASPILPRQLTLALGIALYALFIALIVPGCRKDYRITVLVIFTALLNTALWHLLQRYGAGAAGWSVVISTVAGAAGGAFIMQRKSGSSAATRTEPVCEPARRTGSDKSPGAGIDSVTDKSSAMAATGAATTSAVPVAAASATTTATAAATTIERGPNNRRRAGR